MPRPRKSQSRSIVLFVTIILIILGVFYSLTGINVGGIFDVTVTPSIVNSPAIPTNTAFQPNTTPGSTWWEVYFTDPLTMNDPNNIAGSIEQKLIDQINAAQTSIHIASFEFDLTFGRQRSKTCYA